MRKLIYLSLITTIFFGSCKKKEKDPEPQQQNRAPIVVSETYTIDANSSKNQFDIMLNDTDPDGDTITLGVVSSTSHGTFYTMSSILSKKSSLIFTPSPNYVGVITLTYTIKDSKGNSTNGTVTINVGNAAQVKTYNIIMPYLGESVALANNTSKVLSINANNAISVFGLSSPFGNGEEWAFMSDGKIGMTYTGTTDGFLFSVDTFTSTTGTPAFKLTQQDNNAEYPFYKIN